jgi:hypothetical protein
VGVDDRHITSIDEDGVALAAIKALHSDSSVAASGSCTATSLAYAVRTRICKPRSSRWKPK